MQVVVDKLLINYNTLGKGGKLILLIHGWADKAQTFDLLAVELVKRLPGCRVISLDLPGFGSSQVPAEVWGIEDYANFVADFLKKINSKPFAVVGHSNGGTIAINCVASGKIKPRHLILLASAGVRHKTLKKRGLLIASKPAKVVLKALPKSTQKKVKSRLYSSVGSDYMVAEHMQDTFKKIVEKDVRKEAANIKIPTCLIYGEDDTSTPVKIGELLSDKIARSHLHKLPSTGHFLHQEQVYKVADIIEGCLER